MKSIRERIYRLDSLRLSYLRRLCGNRSRGLGWFPPCCPGFQHSLRIQAPAVTREHAARQNENVVITVEVWFDPLFCTALLLPWEISAVPYRYGSPPPRQHQRVGHKPLSPGPKYVGCSLASRLRPTMGTVRFLGGR